MKRIYCISGLGADHRIFAKLQIPGHALVPVIWIRPDEGETLPEYAIRLSGQIEDKAPIIIGVSLGGMLATEIAKHNPEAKVFIVSSVKSSLQLGFNISFFRWLAKRDLMPPASVIPAGLFYFLGGHEKADRGLLYRMFKETDPYFIRWGMKSILLWESTSCPGTVFHIHGTKDRLISPKLASPDVWIEGGTHFMIYERAAEVSKAIADHL